MNLARSVLLWCSENPWMRKKVPDYSFVRRSVKKFMPGETVEAAIKESYSLNEIGIGTVFTNLGENIRDLHEAAKVTGHYLHVIDKIDEAGIDSEISLKLTHIGFGFSYDKAFQNIKRIIERAIESSRTVWIDMEQSEFTDDSIRLYKEVGSQYRNTGLCLQSYLRRTMNDLMSLIDLNASIRLVKGAYKEPQDIVFTRKEDVDNHYFELSKFLLGNNFNRIALATHDIKLINKIEAYAKANSISPDKHEVQMLYGIKTSEQIRLVNEGKKVKVLISYGDGWYPWYLRRLAERPANIGFVLKNLFTK